MARRGFTLVEMLVVLVIMGLLASTVVLTWPARGALREDAVAFAARTALAAQESILSGKTMGLDVTPAGYAFYRMEEGVWREADGNRAFRRHAWRDGVVPHLRRDGFTAGRRRVGDDAVAPSVVFDPTGLVSAFSVTLAEKGARVVVTADGTGAVRIEEPADE